MLFLDFLAIALKKINLVEQACDAWDIVTKWKCTHELHRLLKTFANKFHMLATIYNIYIFVYFCFIYLYKSFCTVQKAFPVILEWFLLLLGIH
jgi:hypothetical protein